MMMKIPKNYSLGWFPQLNPDPRMRISTDGQILYVNPASIFLLKDRALIRSALNSFSRQITSNDSMQCSC